MNSGFYQKNGFAIRIISRDFLTMEEGDRIPSIEEYTGRLSVSRWVIQVALNYIEENGCVRYEKRGVLGTFLHDINMEKLWEIADLNPLLGLFPFPTCSGQDGLMTGILEAFKKADTPVLSAYLPSSGARFSYLEKDLCHFVLSSMLSVKYAMGKYPDLEIGTIIPNAVCGEPYSLYLHAEEGNRIREGMTLCIHESSLEQQCIAEELQKRYGIEISYGNYQEQGERFKSGEVDLYISRGDKDLRMFPINAFHEFSLDDLGITKDMQTPVIVVKKSVYDMKKIVNRHLDVECIGGIQQAVMDKRIPAKYL